MPDTEHREPRHASSQLLLVATSDVCFVVIFRLVSTLPTWLLVGQDGGVSVQMSHDRTLHEVSCAP